MAPFEPLLPQDTSQLACCARSAYGRKAQRTSCTRARCHAWPLLRQRRVHANATPTSRSEESPQVEEHRLQPPPLLRLASSSTPLHIRCCLNRWQATVEVVEGRGVGTIRGGSGRTGSWRRAEVTGAPGQPPTPRPPHTPPPPPPSRSTARQARCHPERDQ